MNIVQLTQEVSNLAPIHGIDSNGVVSFKDEATESEINAANLYVSENISQLSDIADIYEKALDEKLDSVAREYRYNNRFTFALRAGYPGPYQAEGIAFAQWMDNCNTQAFQLLEDVKNQIIPMPTVEEFLDSLPEFVI